MAITSLGTLVGILNASTLTITLPLLISTIPLDQIMNMFVVGGMHMPVAVQIAFHQGG